MPNCVHVLVDYCRLLIIVHVMNNIMFSRSLFIIISSTVQSHSYKKAPTHDTNLAHTFNHVQYTPTTRYLLFRFSNYMLNISVRTVDLHSSGRWLPDRPGPWGKFVENSTELTCLEMPVPVAAPSKA
jgi:hypothetical protein